MGTERVGELPNGGLQHAVSIIISKKLPKVMVDFDYKVESVW